MSSFQLNLPPSVVAKTVKEEDQDEDNSQKQSREDWKKMKELEEARKAGTAPAMQDEEGKDINPHIPQYIMQAPWYFGATTATLKHQREPEDYKKVYDQLNTWYKRGVKQGTISTKYRKGACENCGAMTHNKKDCLERPRKVGAKFTGENFAPDEHMQPLLSFDYDGKRDRWNGYDLEEHQKIIDDHAKLEEAKQLVKADKLEKAIIDGDSDKVEKLQNEDEFDEDDKYADDVDMPGQKFETKQRITVRNLRIREDTAKYLYNLDVNSAYYDPKTRSMRDNPFMSSGKTPIELQYAGDNWVRGSGSAGEFANRQLFAWEAYESGADVHLQADPTKTELFKMEVDQRKDHFKTDQKQSILEKYGGEEHLEAPPKQLLLAQTEDYVEYSRLGSVIKGNEKSIIRSKYEEDIYTNNHTSVWGSYWTGGRWGFKCCHSFIKESYCTGEAGKAATQMSIVPVPKENLAEKDKSSDKDNDKLKSKKISQKEKSSKKKKRKQSSSSSSSSDSDSSSSSGSTSSSSGSSSSSSSESESEDEEAKKERRLQKAIKLEVAHQKHVDKLLSVNERKRPYNSMFETKAPTEEEMEAFRLKRMRTDDPMAQFTTK